MPYRDTMILIPCQGDKIWIYEKKADKWRVLVDLFSEEFFRLIKGVSLFIGYQYVSKTLLLFPRGGNGMIKINSETEILQIRNDTIFHDVFNGEDMNTLEWIVMHILGCSYEEVHGKVTVGNIAEFDPSSKFPFEILFK